MTRIRVNSPPAHSSKVNEIFNETILRPQELLALLYGQVAVWFTRPKGARAAPNGGQRGGRKFSALNSLRQFRAKRRAQLSSGSAIIDSPLRPICCCFGPAESPSLSLFIKPGACSSSWASPPLAWAPRGARRVGPLSSCCCCCCRSLLV